MTRNAARPPAGPGPASSPVSLGPLAARPRHAASLEAQVARRSYGATQAGARDPAAWRASRYRRVEHPSFASQLTQTTQQQKTVNPAGGRPGRPPVLPTVGAGSGLGP